MLSGQSIAPDSSRSRTRDIHAYIIDHVDAHPRDIARAAAESYGITRQAVNRHLQALIEAGHIEAEGQTRARTYRLAPSVQVSKQLRITPFIQDERLWREYGEPLVDGAPAHIRAICHFGFTEAVNNVLDHARASRITVETSRTPATIEFAIGDDGDGMFDALIQRFGFDDPRHAVLELCKGRLSTLVGRRGGSVYLASRMFDRYEIRCGTDTFDYDSATEAWTHTSVEERAKGTAVRMRISLASDRTMDEVIDTYTAGGGGELSRLHVPVTLSVAEGDAPVSRTQARRLLSRLEMCKEVLLDFRDVDAIGRAYADEIFRVFRNEHPNVTLVTLHASAEVRSRVRQAMETPATAEAPTR